MDVSVKKAKPKITKNIVLYIIWTPSIISRNKTNLLEKNKNEVNHECCCQRKKK